MKRRILIGVSVAVAIIGATAIQAVAVDSSDQFSLAQDCEVPGIVVTISPDRRSERFDIFLGDDKVFSDVPGEVEGDSASYPIEVVDGTYTVTLTGVGDPSSIADDGPETIVIECGVDPTDTTITVVDDTTVTTVPVTVPPVDAPAAEALDASASYTG